MKQVRGSWQGRKRKNVALGATGFDKRAAIGYTLGTRMTDFATLTGIHPIAEGKFSIEVPDGWQQGRGAFGGYGLACLVRAIETTESADERPLRNLNAELCGPLLPGRAEIHIEVLRRGAGMTTVAARTIQKDGIVAHATALLGRAREGQGYDGLAKPNFDAAAMLVGDVVGRPRFTQFFEYRNVGALPYTGHDAAQVDVWVRMLVPGKTFDTAHVIGLTDATWPAMLPTLTTLQPMSTISFTLQTFGPWDGLQTDAPIYHRGRVLWARDGHAAEMREIWTPEGRLLAINHQIFATTK